MYPNFTLINLGYKAKVGMGNNVKSDKRSYTESRKYL